MVTASYAGGWGVASNGYEIWEYPDQSYESGNLEDHCCRQRFVIQTSREHANVYYAMIVGPRGGHTGVEVTSVKGKPLPPTPKSGQSYVLVDPTKNGSGKKS